MLRFKKGATSDGSITSIQKYTYTPYTNAYGYQEEIRIAIQSQNAYILPHDSSLYIECSVVRDAQQANNIDSPSPVRNFAAFLFDSIRYELNGMEIDNCKNVGITSLLKGNVSFTPNESLGLQTSTWNIPESNATTEFSIIIPLKMYFGFAEDYKSLIMNAKHELILTRSRNDRNCFHGANDICSIRIGKIQWRMPHIRVDDNLQLKLLKQIESNEPITMAYRSWDLYEYPSLPQSNRQVWAVKTTTNLTRPRYIILALQTGRNNLTSADNTSFDHCKLTNAQVYLNAEQYPQENLYANYVTSKAAIPYEMYSKFQETYYHDGSKTPSQPLIKYADFLNSPIYIFDCSRQNESLKTSSVDVKIEFETASNVPANTTAYCLILHDNLVSYSPLNGIVTKTL